MRNAFNLTIATIGTYVTYLTGEWDQMIKALALFMVLDYITGVSKGFVTGKVNSSIGAKGIVRKSLIFIVVVMANQMDKANSLAEPIFRTSAIYFYLANEGISIFENLTVIGVPFPGFIKDRFEKVKDITDKGEKIDG